MSQSITVSWSTVDAKYPEASVQVDKLPNHDLILRCQAGLRPDRAAFAELLRRYQTQIGLTELIWLKKFGFECIGILTAYKSLLNSAAG
jgi:hypothetical protein